MRIPTVHLNGTAGEDLLEHYTAAADAVRKAIDVLCDVGFNARDYYVQGSDAAQEAQREHESRIQSLKRVLLELMAIVEGVVDQLDARDATRRPR